MNRWTWATHDGIVLWLSMATTRLSVILPVYNEEQTIPFLYEKLVRLYDRFPSVEIIFVDDCSKDNSLARLRELAAKDKHIIVISFAGNHGQTAALRAGINQAKGDVLVTMDSDLENDPKDIPMLLHKIEEGYDVVSGWRQDRWKKSFLLRKLPSVLANKLISNVTGTHLHDYGCTLKAYRKDVISDLPLYGEMHRFIPAYAAQRGGRVTELPVHYEPRRFGKSNYGISRTFRVLLDLFLIKFLDRYMNRPIHFFGGLGFILFFLGVLAGALAVVLRVIYNLNFVQTPLPILTVFLLLTAINMVMMGIIGEMLMRTYYEVKDRKSYRVKEVISH